jgi:hypothetical protein
MDEIVFAGDNQRVEDQDPCVSVTRAGKQVLLLTGKEVDLNRSQGDIGLFVPDAGYPFGKIPDWLIRQRTEVPDWAPDWAKRVRRYERK